MCKAKTPGSCGELVQGILNDDYLLITCPINMYSEVAVELTDEVFTPKDYEKINQAITLLLQKFNRTEKVAFHVKSDLPRSKGMASSTADIASAVMAVARLLNLSITENDIAKIALAVEPTDAVFFKGIVAFDHIKGRNIEMLGEPPLLHIAMFDVGGEIDTLTFNKRRNLKDWNLAKSDEVRVAYKLVKEGLAENNIVKIGQGATISALANQQILPKPHLTNILTTGLHHKACGINVAHSGTVVGVLFGNDDVANIPKCKEEILANCPGISYIGQVQLISGGII